MIKTRNESIQLQETDVLLQERLVVELETREELEGWSAISLNVEDICVGYNMH